MPQSGQHIQIAQAGGDHIGGGNPVTAGGPTNKTHSTQGVEEHHGYKLGDIPEPGLLFWNGVLVSLIMIVFGIAAVNKLKKTAIPAKAWSVQNLGEWLVEVMIYFTRNTIGPGGEKYTPLIGTIFFFILLGNMWGLIPGFHSPTANLSTTLAIGLIVFFYVQYVGIRSNGVGGYFKHFAGPMIFVAPLLFPIEVISELVKPFTLAMRLFGNIFGEDTVIVVLASLAVTLIPAAPILPLQLPIMVLALLTAFVQALVFTLLACIYISLQSHHEESYETGHPHSATVEANPAQQA